MVKSLKLIDMNCIDPETMAELFRKLNQWYKLRRLENQLAPAQTV
jgi:hypothetical protein